MVEAKRARRAETPKQPSFHLRLRASYFYPTPSALIIILMLSVGFTIYPNLLIATTDPANSLTIYTTATSEYALRLGLIWFSVGITLATGYTLFMYRSFRGKVELPAKGEGY